MRFMLFSLKKCNARRRCENKLINFKLRAFTAQQTIQRMLETLPRLLPHGLVRLFVATGTPGEGGRHERIAWPLRWDDQGAIFFI